MCNLSAVHGRNLLGAAAAVAKSDGDGLAFTISTTQAKAKCTSRVLRYRCGGMARERSIGRHRRR
jgi:hypothetical protein